MNMLLVNIYDAHYPCHIYEIQNIDQDGISNHIYKIIRENIADNFNSRWIVFEERRGEYVRGTIDKYI